MSPDTQDMWLYLIKSLLLCACCLVVRVRVRVRIEFINWLVSGYAHVLFTFRCHCTVPVAALRRYIATLRGEFLSARLKNSPSLASVPSKRRQCFCGCGVNKTAFSDQRFSRSVQRPPRTAVTDSLRWKKKRRQSNIQQRCTLCRGKGNQWCG